MTRSDFRNRIVDVIASRHIAGAQITDALPVCRWANDSGFTAIVSPWAGATDTPQSMLARYLSAIDLLSRSKLQFYLSIKLDALGYDVSLFDSLTAYASSLNIRIHLDSLGPETADSALEFLRRAVKQNRTVGYTLPARWWRSLRDAETISRLGVPVRIVKGQWDDPTAPGLDVRQNYLQLAVRLAKNCPQVGVATHDLGLAKKVFRVLSAAGSHFSLEQFFSLPLNGVGLANEFGCPYRVYVAYGSPGIPYNVRFTRTRPQIAAWIVSDLVRRHKKPWENPGAHQGFSFLNLLQNTLEPGSIS